MEKGQTRIPRQEVSAGGVLYRESEVGPEIAVVHIKKWRGWGLPKGHIEKGESLEEAARREVQEETGVAGSIVQKIDMVEYTYPDESIRIHKKVYYYLMKFVEGKTAEHDAEVTEVEWMTLDRALRVLKYDNDKKIVRRARTLLKHLC